MSGTERLTAAHVLLAVGAAALFAGTLIALGPGAALLPDALESMFGDGTVVGLLLGLVVAVVALLRLWLTGKGTLDRSALVETPPELAVDTEETLTTSHLDERYQRLRRQLDDPNRADRYVAVYGRRAVHAIDPVTNHLSPTPVPPSITQFSGPPQAPQRGAGPRADMPDRSGRRWPDGGTEPTPADDQSRVDPGAWGTLGWFLEDVAATARDTYATATNCGEAEARRAVATGAWTDDRVAAAFLAADVEAAPTFTMAERLVAWLTPRRTFEARLDRTLAAMETHADAFLTFDASAGRTADDENGETDTRDRGAERR